MTPETEGWRRAARRARCARFLRKDDAMSLITRLRRCLELTVGPGAAPDGTRPRPRVYTVDSRRTTASTLTRATPAVTC